jgi:hypothetical protein
MSQSTFKQTRRNFVDIFENLLRTIFDYNFFFGSKSNRNQKSAFLLLSTAVEIENIKLALKLGLRARKNK